MSGWIKIYRDIQEHWIFSDAEKFKAWVIILSTVNFEPKKTNIKNSIYECGRGESLLSLDSWADKFGKSWNKSKVRRFFKLLESDSMIVLKSEQKTTRLTVCNYDIYQDERNANETQTKRKRNANETQTTSTKEGKESKEVKERKEIIDTLNFVTGKSFKYSTDKTISCINARFNEGFIIDDFKKVIEIKSKQWINTDKSIYLRPETLFGNKFEGYLNEAPSIKPKKEKKDDGIKRFKVKYRGDTNYYQHTEKEIREFEIKYKTEHFQKYPI